jgi:hypothetical protein
LFLFYLLFIDLGGGVFIVGGGWFLVCSALLGLGAGGCIWWTVGQ